MNEKGPRYIDHNGFKMPHGFPVDAFESALKFCPKANTILICTYPKCGTTWMQNIVYLLTHRGEPFPSNANVDDDIPHLEFKGREYCENFPVVKTHLPTNLLNWNEQSKYIVVLRNPKDCCVSFYHHTRGFVKYYEYAHGTFDDYFQYFINGDVDFGDYFQYVSSWESRLKDKNVYFCTYEQLVCETKKILKELAAFLDITIDDAILDKVLKNCSFASMQKDQQRWSSERPEDMPAFIRSGKIGDWRNYFSEEQSKLIDIKAEQYPLIKTLWEEYMK